MSEVPLYVQPDARGQPERVQRARHRGYRLCRADLQRVLRVKDVFGPGPTRRGVFLLLFFITLKPRVE